MIDDIDQVDDNLYIPAGILIYTVVSFKLVDVNTVKAE